MAAAPCRLIVIAPHTEGRKVVTVNSGSQCHCHCHCTHSSEYRPRVYHHCIVCVAAQNIGEARLVTSDVMAEVRTEDNGTTTTYSGLTGGTFKDRWQGFRHRKNTKTLFAYLEFKGQHRSLIHQVELHLSLAELRLTTQRPRNADCAFWKILYPLPLRYPLLLREKSLLLNLKQLRHNQVWIPGTATAVKHPNFTRIDCKSRASTNISFPSCMGSIRKRQFFNGLVH